MVVFVPCTLADAETDGILLVFPMRHILPNENDFTMILE